MAWLKIFILSTALCWPTSKVTFETKHIMLGGHKLKVEVADTNQKRSQGLMNRQKLEIGHGMLFVHDESEFVTYWMKNTYIDLSIGFFDKNKKLIEIHELKKTPSVLSTEYDQAQSQQKTKYALEVPMGWFKKNKIKLGDRFKFVD